MRWVSNMRLKALSAVAKHAVHKMMNLAFTIVCFEVLYHLGICLEWEVLYAILIHFDKQEF